MRIIKIIILLMIMITMISPAMALLTSEQKIGGIMVGDNNIQDLDNTVNVYDESQDTTAIQTGGSHNTQIVTSTTNKYVGGSGSSPVSVVVNLPKSEAAYRGFDIGTISTQFISMYEGDPLIIMNDENYPNMVVSNPGDKFRYTVTSSIPVLTYVVSGKDINRVLYDTDVIPIYDVISKKYETGNLDILYMSKFRSPQQQFEVTIEDSGRYALVIDSRVSRNIDGRLTKINGNSFDVMYVIDKISNGTQNITKRKIGVTDIYPIYNSTGMANTQNIKEL